MSTVEKMLQKMRKAQKKGTNQRPYEHKFQVGGIALVKKHNKDKLKRESGYRIIKLSSPWSAVVKNQLSGKCTSCSVTDLKMKHPAEDWEIKALNHINMQLMSNNQFIH